MLISHERIYLDAQGRRTDALLVRQGRVVAVGERARALCAPDEPVICAPGACLFPALADAHIHLWGVGMRVGSIELGDTISAAHIYRRMQTVRDLPDLSPDELSPSGWVLGHGWDDNRWGAHDALQRRELDAIFPDIPVCLHRVDRHALICNSAALRRANLEASYPPGGSGILVDQAMLPVLSAIARADEDEDRQLLLETAQLLRRHGIASAHMALTEVGRVPMLQKMAASGTLPIRVFAMIDGTDPALGEALAAGPIHDPEAWMSARTIKFFADGAMGSRGAHLFEPYPDGTRGLAMHDLQELSATIARLVDAGWQVAVHAIGDAAAHDILDAFAGAPAAKRALVRPRLEHCQMMRDEDARRLDELSVIASIQPSHLRSDGVWAQKMLSPTQRARLFPWREIADCARLAAGSDYPIDDPNPWHGIATALTRRLADGGVLEPHKALTRCEILGAYTHGSAYAAHWEDVLGRLDVGYIADIIALSDDPFSATPEQIWEMQVLQMWMDGAEIAI